MSKSSESRPIVLTRPVPQALVVGAIVGALSHSLWFGIWTAAMLVALAATILRFERRSRP